ncbi:MAG: hypothetical protein IPL61_10400 [Myxococcales bacterium]|nr:hypothetical protein [Myxococcales bacterium]
MQHQRERQRRQQQAQDDRAGAERDLGRDELEEQLVVAGLVEIDHAPVADTDRRGAELAGGAVAALAAAADEVVDLALLALDADRAAHPGRQRQQVATVAGPDDRELGRQRQIRDDEGRAGAGAQRDRLADADAVAHDLAAPDQRRAQRDRDDRRADRRPHSLLSSIEFTISGMNERRSSDARSSSSLARSRK